MEQTCDCNNGTVSLQLRALEEQTNNLKEILTEIESVYDFLDGSKVKKEDKKDTITCGNGDGFVNRFEYLNIIQQEKIDAIYQVLSKIKTKL